MRIDRWNDSRSKLVVVLHKAHCSTKQQVLAVRKIASSMLCCRCSNDRRSMLVVVLRMVQLSLIELSQSNLSMSIATMSMIE